MSHYLARFCIAMLGLCAATIGADGAAVPAEMPQLKGKLVKIYHDVDLLGTGKPSSRHTQYLAIVLEEAGAKVVRASANGKGDEKRPDVVIFGEPIAPAKLDPAEARDPFMAAKAQHMAEDAKRYQAERPALERAAAAAGSRVIRSDDVATALRIRATEPQMIEALDARARDALKLQIPETRFQANRFEEVISFLRDVSGANIRVNWRALEAAGVNRGAPLTLNLGSTPLSEVLDRVLSQAGGNNTKLAYAIRAGVIEISTADDLKPPDR
jgi:hypothetical protein